MKAAEQATDSPTVVAGQTAEFRVHFTMGDRGRRRVRMGAPPTPAPSPGRVPRVTLLLALAIRFDRMVREGAVKDYADLARMGGVTRARVSQIMDLLNLAPDIQEEILMLPRRPFGWDLSSERCLRQVVAKVDWREQRQGWESLRGAIGGPARDARAHVPSGLGRSRTLLGPLPPGMQRSAQHVP